MLLKLSKKYNFNMITAMKDLKTTKQNLNSDQDH